MSAQSDRLTQRLAARRRRDPMSLRTASILSLATFVLVALGAVYILGRPWQHGWGLEIGYLSWKDRLLYAGGL